jgi:ankyrin repeat protein
MKIKTTAIILTWLASVGLACASTSDITTLVQKGLFEEEASHHLDAAMEYYQEAIGNFDKDRQLTATAIFHLGECYRLQGKTNEANIQYQRIVREFSDQPQLVELSRGYLPKTAGHPSFAQNLTRITEGKPEESTDEQQEVRRIEDIIQNSPDLINTSGRLAAAARNGWMSAAKLLVDNGAIIDQISQAESTPLSMAADAGNKGMVTFLLSRGANVNKLDGHRGWTPLQFAVSHGFKSVAETLLANGADVNAATSSSGDRPLHLAVWSGYTELAELLLEHKADINAPSKDGETPLFRAIKANRIEMVRFLISKKTDVNIKSTSGQTPLLLAAGTKDINVEIVKALLDSGASVESSVKDDHPLDLAVSYGRADVVELLLQYKADPNDNGLGTLYATDASYIEPRLVTPLILAISSRSDAASNIASILLQHSANPNLADESGETPLDYAINYRNTNIIGDLIAHHADVNAVDKQNDPPLAYASRLVTESALMEQIKQTLIHAGASEDYQRRGAIFITQKGTGSIGDKVFSKGTRLDNHYTLFDLIATAYHGASGSHAVIAFPDFAHVAINRLKADGSKEEIAVDLNAMLQSGDCSKNPGLEWGDIVLIPQMDHKLNEFWQGLSESERGALGKCLLRKVKIIVKGQTTELALLPPIVQWYAANNGGISDDANLSASLTGALNGARVLYDYDLNSVVHQANVLLISSDLRRVKVTRRESADGGKPLVMAINLEAQPSPDVPRIGFPGWRPLPPTDARIRAQNPSAFQLSDGDIIEIPERNPN